MMVQNHATEVVIPKGKLETLYNSTVKYLKVFHLFKLSKHL